MSAPEVDSKTPAVNDDETSSDSSVDSLPIEQDANPAPVSSTTLPLTPAGTVSTDINIVLSRTRKGTSPRGYIFSLDRSPGQEITSTTEQTATNPAQLPQLLFGSVESWVYKSSRNEIVFKKTSTDTTGPELGNVNFHHWILDRSKDVILSLPNGFATNLVRATTFQAHRFNLPASENGTELFWKPTRGVEGVTLEEDMSRLRQNFKCVNANDELYATYTSKLGFCRSQGPQKRTGSLTLHREGLSPAQAELLMMTALTVVVKSRKRMLQASQAGQVGGLVTTGMYAIAG